MEVGEVKQAIRNKTPQHFYIFTGEEYKVQDIYVSKISEVTGKGIERLDSINQLFHRGKALFYIPKTFVLRDDSEFIKTEKMWDKLDNALQDDNLIFLWTSVDKRTKFYKRYSDLVVTFNHMEDMVLLKYTKKAVDLSNSNLELLTELCENSYGRVLIEADKIKLYSRATGKSLDDAFIDLVNQGVIYTPPQDAIFKFVDAIIVRNPNEAFRLLEECKKIGEPNLRLITVLFTNLKRILMVQACPSKDISKSTGLSSWDIKCTDGKLSYWRNGELVYLLELLRKLEKGIKVGTIDESIAIDYFMVNAF